MTQRMQLAFFMFAAFFLALPFGATSACDEPNTPELLDGLESDDPVAQAQAAESLEWIARDLKDAVPVLERVLASKDTRARLAAVSALWAIQGISKTHMAVIVSGLTDDIAENRETAADLLRELGPQAVSAVPLLITLLTDENAGVRAAAAGALGGIGPTAKSAIPNLVTAITDRDKVPTGAFLYSYTVGDAAGLALRRIGPDSIPAIAPLLKYDDKEIRLRAMWVLAGGREASRQHIPVLLESLSDDDIALRQAAAEILGDLRIAPTQSVPALAALLKDEDKNIRFWSATSLARYGPQAESVLPQLIAALQDDHPGVRARAADAIGNIGPAAEEALPHLKRLREDQDFFFYPHAAMNYVGPHAEKAIEKIQGVEGPKSSDEQER